MSPEPLISFDQVYLAQQLLHTGRRVEKRFVLENVSAMLPRDRYMICADEADRQCIIDLFCGRRDPAAGTFRYSGRVSYPIGRIAPFSVAVRGREFVRFLSEVYDFCPQDAIEELEARLPDSSILSNRMDKSEPQDRLAMSIALAAFIAADIVLIDGNLIHPNFPDHFVRYIGRVINETIQERMVIVSSRQFLALRPIVNKGIHVRNGQLTVSDHVINVGASAARAFIPQPAEEEPYDEIL